MVFPMWIVRNFVDIWTVVVCLFLYSRLYIGCKTYSLLKSIHSEALHKSPGEKS